jgi:hypothetical protein
VDDARPMGQVSLLLASEVIVEAVDDEDGDEGQRQGDDADEAKCQARLEGPRGEPAEERQPAAVRRFSARRTRNRRLVRS